MYFYRYLITYWTEAEEQTITRRGYVVGESYRDALLNLSEYYEDRDTVTVTLSIVEDGDFGPCRYVMETDKYE